MIAATSNFRNIHVSVQEVDLTIQFINMIYEVCNG